MDFTHKNYNNERVDLCNNTFNRCVFNHCMLVFDGTGPANLNGCDMDASNFAFDGPAGTTLLFLTNVYKDGGAHVIEEIFSHIREGRYTRDNVIETGGVN